MTAWQFSFADQLGPHFALPGHRILMVESTAALRRRRYHRQKLHLILSALRHRAAELGGDATLIRARTYSEALDRLGEPVVVHEPTSMAADAFVRRLQERGAVTEIRPTPGFTLPREEFTTWAGNKPRLRMEEFYRWQRHRLEVLVEGNDPVGGRWSYDTENRDPPPKTPTLAVAPPFRPTEDDIDAGVRDDLDRAMADDGLAVVGSDGPRLFAATRAEAEQALATFVSDRLPLFGRYEDAMLAADWAMAHSLLSVPMNLGLLDPLEVVGAAVAAFERGDAPLAAVEGFVRQVIGWREFVWQCYWHFGPNYRSRNHFGADTPLPDWFAELAGGRVDAACLSDALTGLHERGWLHHIQRLMVLGNWAIQRGYQPDELTEWFQTAFVDGYDWVMPANIVGMSQHADGGAMATKPYLSGGAYINTMSDYCRGCRYDPKKRTGPTACPFTAGYWNFLDTQADRLAANPRMRRPLQGRLRLTDLSQVVAQEQARGNAAP